MTMEPIEKTIRIKVLEHQRTDLLMAFSPDMPGLVVHGRSAGELEEKIPGALKDLLEAQGFVVEHVDLIRDNEHALPDFGPPAFIANASLATAQT